MQVAMAMRRTIRSVDTPARIGGDEFCVLAPHQTPSRAALLAERLAEAVEREVATPDGAGRRASRSAWSPAPSTARTPRRCSRSADRAMYRAKARRGERRRWPSERRSAYERAALRRTSASKRATAELLDQAVADADRHGLRARGRLELGQDALGVRAHGLRRQAQLLATASVCIPSASIWRISRWRALSVRSPSSSTIVDDSPGST